MTDPWMPKQQRSQHPCSDLFVDWVEVGSLNELMQQEASLHILQTITHLERAKNSSCCMLSNLTADIFLMQMCETPRCLLEFTKNNKHWSSRLGSRAAERRLSTATTSEEPHGMKTVSRIWWDYGDMLNRHFLRGDVAHDWPWNSIKEVNRNE